MKHTSPNVLLYRQIVACRVGPVQSVMSGLTVGGGGSFGVGRVVGGRGIKCAWAAFPTTAAAMHAAAMGTTRRKRLNDFMIHRRRDRNRSNRYATRFISYHRGSARGSGVDCVKGIPYGKSSPQSTPDPFPSGGGMSGQFPAGCERPDIGELVVFEDEKLVVKHGRQVAVAGNQLQAVADF